MAQGPLPGGATQTDPLAQLRDIHLPPPPEMWPPAPGWWVLAFFGVVLAVVGLVWIYRWWSGNRYRREGLEQLDSLLRSYRNTQDGTVYITGYSALLKRVALSRYPREQVASLTGEAWVQFLDRAASTNEFSMGNGQALISGSYTPEPDVDVEELHKLGEFWIRHHMVTSEGHVA